MADEKNMGQVTGLNHYKPEENKGRIEGVNHYPQNEGVSDATKQLKILSVNEQKSTTLPIQEIALNEVAKQVMGAKIANVAEQIKDIDLSEIVSDSKEPITQLATGGSGHAAPEASGQKSLEAAKALGDAIHKVKTRSENGIGPFEGVASAVGDSIAELQQHAFSIPAQQNTHDLNKAVIKKVLVDNGAEVMAQLQGLNVSAPDLGDHTQRQFIEAPERADQKAAAPIERQQAQGTDLAALGELKGLAGIVLNDATEVGTPGALFANRGTGQGRA